MPRLQFQGLDNVGNRRLVIPEQVVDRGPLVPRFRELGILFHQVIECGERPLVVAGLHGADSAGHRVPHLGVRVLKPKLPDLELDLDGLVRVGAGPEGRKEPVKLGRCLIGGGGRARQRRGRDGRGGNRRPNRRKRS